MKPFIRKKLPVIMIIAQMILILGLLFYIVPGRYRLYDIVLYDASENVPANPRIGYAPDALLTEDCAETDLVFLLLPFSEWEPEEGVFDKAGVSLKYHLDEYRSAGKRAVLRFVCDIPGEQVHADIPDWLMKAAGGGAYYEDAGGKGYAPPYENEVFLAEHEKALQALADWCRQESFVVYVELGSVGRNGVWDDHGPSGSAPSNRVLEQVVRQYEAAFPAESGIRLLYSGASASVYSRIADSAPVDEAAAETSGTPAVVPAGGSWKDVLGEPEEAGRWASGTIAPPEESGLWEKAPVGGGLSRFLPMDDLLNASLSGTLEQIRSCHISFIGPSCPDALQQQTNGSEMILRNVGYCIYLSRLQTTVDYLSDSLQLHFTFANIGNTPLYWDWPVTMYVYDRSGSCIRQEVLDLRLSELQPGQEMTVTGSVPYKKNLLKGYSVGLSILSPEGEAVTFAQKGVLPDAQGIHKIYRYWGAR